MLYSKKGLPFTFKGVTAVGDCKTAVEVLEKANLNWDAAECQVVGKIPTSDVMTVDQEGNILDTEIYVPNHKVIYRTDNNSPLGVVKNKYRIVQNKTAFEFFDSCIGDREIEYYTAGCLDNGARVFLTAKLPSKTIENGKIKDQIDNYLIFMNSHDGSSGVKVFISPIRMVCENCLNAAIRSASNYIAYRHTESVHNRLLGAKDILGLANTKIEYALENFEWLANRKADDRKAASIFCHLIMSKEEAAKMNTACISPLDICTKKTDAVETLELSTRKLNIVSGMYEYYLTGIGQQEIIGTDWGIYNAVTGYYSNVDSIENEKRMDSIMFGDKSKKIQQCMTLLQNSLEAA